MTLEDLEDEDDICPKTGKRHEPDWDSVTVEADVELYIDVSCKHCRRSGCVGSAETLAENINW